MPGTGDLSVNDLADRIFRLPEKWGWEFREPVAARPQPRMGRELLWVEPAKTHGVQHHSQAPVKRIVIVVVILLVGLGLRQSASC